MEKEKLCVGCPVTNCNNYCVIKTEDFRKEFSSFLTDLTLGYDRMVSFIEEEVDPVISGEYARLNAALITLTRWTLAAEKHDLPDWFYDCNGDLCGGCCWEAMGNVDDCSTCPIQTCHVANGIDLPVGIEDLFTSETGLESFRKDVIREATDLFKE